MKISKLITCVSSLPSAKVVNYNMIDEVIGHRHIERC